MTADDGRRALARFERAELVEVPGNHATFAFGERAPGAAAVIRDFVCASVPA